VAAVGPGCAHSRRESRRPAPRAELASLRPGALAAIRASASGSPTAVLPSAGGDCDEERRVGATDRGRKLALVPVGFDAAVQVANSDTDDDLGRVGGAGRRGRDELLGVVGVERAVCALVGNLVRQGDPLSAGGPRAPAIRLPLTEWILVRPCDKLGRHDARPDDYRTLPHGAPPSRNA